MKNHKILIDENEHEILEQLWIITEEKKLPGLALEESDIGDFNTLIKKDLIIEDGRFIKLTSRGRKEAARAVRRHRLAERLLADVLSSEKNLLHQQACRMEHVLFDGIDDKICTLLGHPKFCPHGSPIPPGDCCLKKQAAIERVIAPLTELKPKQEGQIAYLHLNHEGHLKKLMAMGVLPGTPVKLVRRYPSVVFQAGNSQFAVDEEIASDIHVRLQQK